MEQQVLIPFDELLEQFKQGTEDTRIIVVGIFQQNVEVLDKQEVKSESIV